MASQSRSDDNVENRSIGSEQDEIRNMKEKNVDLPGYPHYPAEEDIMDPANGFLKTNADNENLTSSGRYIKPDTKTSLSETATDLEDYDDLGIVSGTEADVTPEDLQLLGPREGDADMGDDELVQGKIQPVGRADEELDIPGAELDDDSESVGEEDEENNYYSLGGDRHENLEENQS